MMLALIILAVFSIGILFLGFVKQRNLIIPASLLAVILAIISISTGQSFYNGYLFGMLETQGNAYIMTLLILFTALCIIPFFTQFQQRGNQEMGDFLGLFLFSILGAIIMVSSQNYMILFIGIEILSLSMYVLAGADRRKLKSNEAALKYFITGAFASAIFLFGVALMYAATGSISFAHTESNSTVITDIAFLFLFVSFAIKIAIVPFHFWAPDVYEGTPTLFTAVMATLVKLAAFGALIRIIQASQIILPVWMDWFFILLVIMTLVYGNIVAMSQRSVKRLLAYSSIVQAGFILIGFIQLDNNSAWILNYYLLAYILSSLICFLIVHFVEQQSGSDDIDSFAGLSSSNKPLAILMSFALISLVGGPFTAGFIAKLLVLQHSVLHGYISLVIIAVLCTLMSVYYYYKIINVMFSGSADAKWSTPFIYKGMLALFVILTLAAGIVPVFFTEFLN